MKQATPNIRTIDHADHTDIERLFYVYSPDGKGGVSTSAIWAVVWCGLKQEKQAMTGYNGLNSVKTNLAKAGICKHDGLRFTDPKCTHATDDQIAYTKKMDEDYDFMQEHKDQARLCNRVVEDVSPRLNLLLDVCGDIDAGNGEILPIEVGGVDAVDAQRWQDNREPYTDRKVKVPQTLQSYATYKNTGKAQPLNAEDVDGEQLGMDDNWYHDNPNY